ncbi:hypothetical protein L0F63_002472, partial [Massospora cicadina]
LVQTQWRDLVSIMGEWPWHQRKTGISAGASIKIGTWHQHWGRISDLQAQGALVILLPHWVLFR